MALSTIASEALIERLADWGVDTVFGLPGDGINGIMEGLRRHQDKVRFVLVHHEEAAAFMATGYAKATGRIGVCLATSGPGGIHLLNGLYDAKLDHAPVLAITGMQETSVLGTGYQQEVNLDKLYQRRRRVRPDDLQPGPASGGRRHRDPHRLRRRGVAHLTIPNDMQVADADADPWQHVAPARSPQTAPVMLPAPGRPGDEDLRADRRPAQRRREDRACWSARARCTPGTRCSTVAEMLGAPIVKTLSGKAVVPDDSPYTTGGIGLLGTRPTEELMDEIDTLFMVGTNFPYTKHLPAPGKVRVAQIEVDPIRAGSRVADRGPGGRRRQGGAAGAAAAAQRGAPTPRSWRSARSRWTSWREQMAALEDRDRDPIAPQYLVGVLDELAADDAILTCDSGTIATWAARHWTIRGDREFYLSGNLATMAPGLPYAIGIQHAFPGRQVIAFVGDGGFAMLMAEFLTAVRHQLPVKVVINNNNSLGPDPVGADGARLPRARGPLSAALRRTTPPSRPQRRLGDQGRQGR